MNAVNAGMERAGIHVLTSFAIRDRFDTGPTAMAIQRACELQTVQRIHILSETPWSIAQLSLPFLTHPKITYVTVLVRPSYAELFNYCNELDLADCDVVAIMNSDVCFADDSDIEKAVKVLDIARERGRLGILAITRHDIIDGKPTLTLRDTTGLPNCVTADCWVFRPPIPLIKCDYFHLGAMNCDAMLAYLFAEAGYCLLNPCIDVKVVHYETHKADEYYESLNQSERAKNTLGWHWATNCNSPYKTYGVPWTTSSNVESGHLPFPLVYQNKRIYLLFERNFAASLCETILALCEIISRLCERDLVVLYEHGHCLSAPMIERLSSTSQRVCMLPIVNTDDVIDNLLSEKNWYGDSCAVVSRFDYLSKNLLHEFHSVIFDTRLLNTACRISAPVGYPDLRVFAENRYPHIKFDFGVVFESEFIDSNQCTLITSIFRSDDYLNGFKKNITALNGYVRTPHVLLFSTVSDRERTILKQWRIEHKNAILCWFKADPGLYECWNVGIRVAQTEFISNANVDDLRHPDHVSQLIADLHSHPTTSIGATVVVPFYQYVDDIKAIDSTAAWYSDQTGLFGFENLAYLDSDDKGSLKLTPNNMPHCMPVWRKSLHDDYGFFNEARYGTYADWAFWLKVTKAGGTGYLSRLHYTYYFVNLNSHNRRGDELARLHKAIENEFLADFYFRSKEPFPRKLFLEGLSQSFGQHRNSFNRLIDALSPLHSDAGGVRFIPFIERYFVWGTDDGEASSSNPMPLHQNWIGILHVPFDAPTWFEFNVSPEHIFQTELWKKSLPYCRGIICLAEDLKEDLSYWYPKLPIVAVKHPTELNVHTWLPEAYAASPCVVQVGAWLRRLQAIHILKAPGHKKVMLLKANTQMFLEREMAVFGGVLDPSVEMRDLVSNAEYDALLARSVVICMLYSTAANNVVIECIARATPILINPLPAVIEYLGTDYPLYVCSLTEADEILANPVRVSEAHEYLLQRRSAIDLTYDGFCRKISQSLLYEQL